jgi:hypothetical protein
MLKIANQIFMKKQNKNKRPQPKPNQALAF